MKWNECYNQNHSFLGFQNQFLSLNNEKFTETEYKSYLEWKRLSVSWGSQLLGVARCLLVLPGACRPTVPSIGIFLWKISYFTSLALIFYILNLLFLTGRKEFSIRVTISSLVNFLALFIKPISNPSTSWFLNQASTGKLTTLEIIAPLLGRVQCTIWIEGW